MLPGRAGPHLIRRWTRRGRLLRSHTKSKSNMLPAYKILGSDGKEYGPVSADAVRLWIAQKRAQAATSAQADGDAHWQPLSSFTVLLPLMLYLRCTASAQISPLSTSRTACILKA